MSVAKILIYRTTGNTLRVEFERLLQTGDTTRDRVISPCTPTPIIWATGAAVPVTPDTPQQHSFATVGGIQSYRFCISCTSPSAPQNVQIVSSGSNWVVVSWTEPASTGGVPIESYLITAVPRGGADLISRTIPATSLRTNLTNLPSSTTFSIAVQASHCLGGSDLSSEVSYTSLAARTIFHTQKMFPIPSLTSFSFRAGSAVRATASNSTATKSSRPSTTSEFILQ
jgi:hypothetical protein